MRHVQSVNHSSFATVLSTTNKLTTQNVDAHTCAMCLTVIIDDDNAKLCDNCRPIDDALSSIGVDLPKILQKIYS